MKKLLLFLLLLTLPLFFLSSNCLAGVNWKRFDFFKLNGGLNNGFSDTKIEDNEFSDLQNVVFSEGGNVKTRDGYAKINTETIGNTTAGTGVFFYKQADGDKFLVSVWDDDTIHKMDYVSGEADGDWDDITGALSFNATADTFASFAVGEDILMIEDGIGTTAPYAWDGSGDAAALGGSPPDATMITYHKQMAFAAGDSSNPSTLYFSDLGDIENWTTGLSGNVNVETNDGTIITAIVPGFDALYVYKGAKGGGIKGSTWRLSGSDKDSFELQRMVSDIGTPVHQAVGRIGNDFIFPSMQGDIFLYDGSIKVRKISSKIQGTIDDLNFSRFDNSPAIIFDEDFYLSVTAGAGTTNDRILFFDTFQLAWSVFKGINANAMAVAEDEDGKEMLVFLDYTGFAYQYPSGTNDAGTAIADFVQTKQFRFPEVTPLKYITLIRVFANQEGNYNLVTEVRSDFEGAGTAFNINLQGSRPLYGTAIYGIDTYGGENLIIGRIEPVRKGENFFQLEFKNDNIDEPWELTGFQIFLEESEEL